MDAERQPRPDAGPLPAASLRGPIYVVVRQTTDWDDDAVFQAQIPDGFRSSVALWDATFEMPYRVFRRELARIASLNLSRVAGIARAKRGDVPDGAVVVPSDDDDWFAPGMGAALQAALEDGCAGYYWPSAFIEVPISWAHRAGLLRRAIFPGTRPKWLCTTNNYAVTMRPGVDPLIRSHIAASRWFIANPGRVKRLNAHLSVMNRTLASQTSFRSVRSRAALLRKYRRYLAVYRRPLPAALAWCAPDVSLMRDLMDELRVRPA